MPEEWTCQKFGTSEQKANTNKGQVEVSFQFLDYLSIKLHTLLSDVQHIQEAYYGCWIIWAKEEILPPKCWIASLELTVLDKDVLLSPTWMLNDSLINAAQKVLKKQFPTVSGLQDVELGSWMSFRYQAGEFAQVIHTTQDH